VTDSGIPPLASHIEALWRFLQTFTVGQLQKFLGMINFYRRSIPWADKLLQALKDAFRGGQMERLEWSLAKISAFSNCKQAICKAAELPHGPIRVQIQQCSWR
jgi:hypothetical protein